MSLVFSFSSVIWFSDLLLLTLKKKMLRPRFLPSDDWAVCDSERKAAKLHFSQLGNREDFLLEVEKSSREKTMKNCVTDEGCASKVNPEIDTRIETDSNKGLFIPFPSWEIKDSITSTSASQGSGTPAQKLDICPLGTQIYMPQPISTVTLLCWPM